jgi:hypothetical protein
MERFNLAAVKGDRAQLSTYGGLPWTAIVGPENWLVAQDLCA